MEVVAESLEWETTKAATFDRQHRQASGCNGWQTRYFASLWTSNLRRATLQTFCKENESIIPVHVRGQS